MNKIRIVSQGYLSENEKFSYCPHCVQELEIEGKDYKEILKPLKWVRTCEQVEIGKGNFEDYFDVHYECSRCGNQRISPDTFSNIYGDKNSVLRSKRLPIDGVFRIWSSEKQDFVDGVWDKDKNNYIELDSQKNA